MNTPGIGSLYGFRLELDVRQVCFVTASVTMSHGAIKVQKLSRNICSSEISC